ncbi:lantibiotic dehydratase family protein [Aquimarina algiphila]|uniref:lantibiotic dehydratase family protein n=1 Tax=Aquimarina algiphila TaxID=2047982 RepID=UPI00248FD136|nr:lantibiotic dehydratase family protein [Aquimarina algiphila]
MKQLITYKPAKEYILRTHNLSSSHVMDLTIEKIKKLCSSPIINEAIFLASLELHQEMVKYLQGKKVKNEDKLINSLLKYLLRMGYRCTPFGLFSGCSLGHIDNETAIELDEIKNNKRITRIDMSYLCSLVQKLEQSNKIRKELKYYPNSSIYPVHNKLRYVEYKYNGTNRSHYTISIDNSEYVDLVLKKAKKGASIQELAELIVEPDISFLEAITFINQLIDNQILVSSISPSVTGKDYLTHLINKVPSKEIKIQLRKINELLIKLDNNRYETNLIYYRKLSDILDSLGVAYNKKYLFQTDLIISCHKNTISSTIVKDIEKAVQLLNKLTLYKEDEKLKRFKEKFYIKFEEEQIPLSLALDVETGIGYGSNTEEDYDISPLISGLDFSGNNHTKNYKDIQWSKTDELLNRKLIESSNKNDFEISLTDNDIESLEENWDNLPLSFTVVAHLLNNDQDNPLINISFIGGSSATYMLGRYTLASQQIDKYVKRIVKREEEQKDAIFAEISHLPENRIGNILNRSHIRTYEIPYLATSTLSDDKQILIDDILISIEEDRIVLFSKKHNKEIIPRMATAHNFSYNSLPIYQFLCDVQTQNLRDDLEFNWGNAKQGRDFLPRLKYKNIILSPAKWIIKKEEILKISQLKDLSKWRKEKNIPQKILLVDSDNELLIDLEHSLTINMFLFTIKKRSQIIIKEYLFDEQNSLVRRNNEVFTNELFFSFIKQNQNNKKDYV